MKASAVVDRIYNNSKSLDQREVRSGSPTLSSLRTARGLVHHRDWLIPYGFDPTASSYVSTRAVRNLAGMVAVCHSDR